MRQVYSVHRGEAPMVRAGNKPNHKPMMSARPPPNPSPFDSEKPGEITQVPALTPHYSESNT